MTGDKNAAANTDEFASHKGKTTSLQQLALTGARRKSHTLGVQQGEPLNGASVVIPGFGLPEGWIVKSIGPFRSQVLLSFSKS